jgi:hypothetical protein
MKDGLRRSIPTWHYRLEDDTRGIPRRLAPGITTRIFPGANVMLSIVRFEPGSVGPVHSHRPCRLRLPYARHAARAYRLPDSPDDAVRTRISPDHSDQ